MIIKNIILNMNSGDMMPFVIFLLESVKKRSILILHSIDSQNV